jgi:hypothetical protein
MLSGLVRFMNQNMSISWVFIMILIVILLVHEMAVKYFFNVWFGIC